MNFSRGVGGSLSHLWKFRRGGGAISSLQKWKIQGGGGVLSEIPSVVGVWIFSGTTQSENIPVWTKVNQWEKEDKKQNCKSVLPQYPHSSFIKDYYLREFDKKSLKHCPSGDHLISFHNLSPRLGNEIVWRKFMLVTWGLNGLRWNAFVHQNIL